jgi:hypothetical protein
MFPEACTASSPQCSCCPPALFSCYCSSSCGPWTLAPGKWAPELPLTSGLDSPCLQQLPLFLVTHADKQASGLLLPKGLVPPCLQHYCTALWEPTTSKKAPKLPLPEDMDPPCLQQLLWLLVIHTCKQAPGLLLPSGLSSRCYGSWKPMPAGRPQGLHCIVGTRQFKPANFATHLATQFQKPSATHARECQAPHFAILLVQEASLPSEHKAQHKSPSLLVGEPLGPHPRAGTQLLH